MLFNPNANFSGTFTTDDNYEAGVILCPNDQGVFSKCSHPGCPMCAPISDSPSLSCGQSKDSDGNRISFLAPLAFTGNVLVNTSVDIPRRVPIISDGQGGVRGLNPGEAGFSIGYSLAPSENGKVLVFLRSQYVSRSERIDRWQRM